MKKALTLFAAVMLLASASFAQTNARRMTAKDMAKVSPAAMFKAQQQKPAAPVATPSAPKNVTSFPWTEDFESGTTPSGFTLIDSDNDGNNWDPTYLYGQGYGHNGSDGMIASASYDNNSGALTPDNWMILPTFDIPAGSDFELTWYEKGQDANYADEFYSVYINTTGNTVANFTATTAVLTSTATGDWVKKTVNLASYAGQTIYIAFRHHNVTDMFYLDIDDMRIGAAGAPEVSVSGPAIALVNDPATFTATSTVNTLTWYVDGVQESATGLTLTYTFTTAGMHEVVAEATNNVGSAYDTLNVNVVDCGGAIDNFPYTENFEAANPCWLFVSADPANDDNTGITTEEAIEGTSSFVLSSYASATSGDYNQFLISPEFDLPTTSDFMVKFWYMGDMNTDAFRVKVSTTTRDTAAFTTVLADLPTVATTWTEVAYTLPAGTKYIAINYYGDYAYYLYIDAFSVEEMGAPIVTLDGPIEMGTNMPATYTATANLADTLVWYVDGTDANNVGNELTTTFTTSGNHEIVVEATNIYGSNSDTLIVNVIECNAIDIPHTFDLATEFNLCWDNPEDGWDTLSDDSGNFYLYSMSNLYGFIDLDPDNWIYTPTLTMPAEGSFDIAWQVAPYTTQLPSDHYGVYVVQGNNATLLREETLNASMNGFQQRVVSIPASITGDFKIAFRHYETSGGYVILLGDIKVVSTGSVVGINDVNNINVAVYPNPASDKLNIEGEGISEVQLMDINGRTVMTANNGGVLSIASLTNGVYVIRVVTAEGVHTQKIVKQ
ncbi:MAG: choice-of-anchor J domain-containing protein [Bacteroidales bacterium]|nr:choice-of-anchor J domain-containing protein [Bacteroidales bacterium]MBR4774118.1 choice-of-anchor J domain-containing protein [Bacteroidales bacterium]